jgi:hypothetical protein
MPRRACISNGRLLLLHAVASRIVTSSTLRPAGGSLREMWRTTPFLSMMKVALVCNVRAHAGMC